MPDGRYPALFAPGSWSETSRIAAILRKETVGGALLLVVTLLALVWANSPWAGTYDALRAFEVGPASLHLNLSLRAWAADGLLAIFFFVVGLELKREFVAGDLRAPQRAALPILAAVGGMAMPALVYVVINGGAAHGALRGWAIPTATDIAFALAALAIVGTHLPAALRTFLLTLAVVDDLLAVALIGIFYTSNLDPLPLLAAIVPLVLFAFLVQRRHRAPWLLLPLAVATWALVHRSGVHPTIAGVLLGCTVPVLRQHATREPDGDVGLAEHLEHLLRPISTGLAVPVFAFLAAGVTVGGLHGLIAALTDPVALGIVAGLVAGKTAGIFGTTYLLSRFTHVELHTDLRWWDVLGMSVLGGIGFTVSLLIGDLAFAGDTAREAHVKVAVLAGTALAAVLAAAILGARNRVYHRLLAVEARDVDADGIPDIYQADSP